MQHDDLDREQAICASPISAYCQHHCDFSRAARTAWPARIEECRRLRDVIADWKVEENLWKEREAALLEEIERLKEAGKVLARYLEDMDDQGYHPVPIDAQDRAAAKLFHPLWEGD